MCSLRRPRVQVVERVVAAWNPAVAAWNPAVASSERGTLMRIACLLSVTPLLALLASPVSSAQGTLTAQDRAEIQELSAKYARTLGSCAAEEYADLFAPDTGYFASNIRGEVVGRERLMALVRSERHCIAPAPQASSNATPTPATAGPGANAAPRPVPTVAIEISSTGPIGRADLG